MSPASSTESPTSASIWRSTGHAISYPTYDIETIGAGGGSIAWIDSGGCCESGPQSAGSDPGPACYGRGGTLPTVTDANLVLGRYDEWRRSAGPHRLDPGAGARAAIDSRSPARAHRRAGGRRDRPHRQRPDDERRRTISRRARSRRARLHARRLWRGRATHAAEIAAELVDPAGAHAALSRLRVGLRRGHLRNAAATSSDRRPAVRPSSTRRYGRARLGIRRAARSAAASTREVPLPGCRACVETWLDLPLRGQAYELARAATLGDRPATPSWRGRSRRSTDLHRQLYGHSFDDVPVELVNLRVKGFGGRRAADVVGLGGHGDRSAGSAPARPVHFASADALRRRRRAPARSRLAAQRSTGPAVIHQSTRRS